MRYAIFGDIHSNLEALESVLEDAFHQDCNAFACTGDVVGYHANPRECINLVRSLEGPVVMGDFDRMIASDETLSDLNPVAKYGLQWQRRNINADNRDYLINRPLTLSMEHDDWGLVHATLDAPHQFVYLVNEWDAKTHFTHQVWNIAFFGHTHTPRFWQYDSESAPEEIDPDTITVIGNHRIYAFNVGSVGQSGDGDWRASYGIFDTEERTVELRRVEYDIELTRLKVRQSGAMPPRLDL